jgi:hypothetical protein
VARSAGEFEPQPAEIVILEHWGSSGFANTNLDLQLKKHGPSPRRQENEKPNFLPIMKSSDSWVLKKWVIAHAFWDLTLSRVQCFALRAVVEIGGAGGVALRCLFISVTQPQQAVDYQSILNRVVERI